MAQAPGAVSPTIIVDLIQAQDPEQADQVCRPWLLWLLPVLRGWWTGSGERSLPTYPGRDLLSPSPGALAAWVSTPTLLRFLRTKQRLTEITQSQVGARIRFPWG